MADEGPEGDTARARLRGHRLIAPELIDLGTAPVIRRQRLAGQLDRRRAELALADLLPQAPWSPAALSWPSSAGRGNR